MPSHGPFGYLHDPPKASDMSFSAVLRPKLTQVTGGDVDLRPYATPSNQYSAGSCVGNATADAFEIINAIAGHPPVQLSRLFIYTMARNMMDQDRDGRPDIDKDDGTFIRLAFDVVTNLGVCREDLPVEQGGWPYDLTKLHRLPSLKAMRAATGHHIHSSYRISETGTARIERVIEALRANHPVVFGTDVGVEFQDISSMAPMGPPTGEILGGHAMVIVGVTGQEFIVKNSWGTAWGEKGYWLMSPDYLTWGKTVDLWVPTMGAMFR